MFKIENREYDVPVILTYLSFYLPNLVNTHQINRLLLKVEWKEKVV